jgi:hypothetical protein
MIRSPSLRSLASTSAVLAVVSTSTPASPQAPPLSESIAIGAWTFRPSLEVRIRGEYKHHPVDTGGNVYDSTAVLAEGSESTLPTIIDSQEVVKDQYMVAERIRLGLAIDRGPVTGVLVLQDARVFGTTQSVFVGPGEPALPSLAPYEAYVDVHSRSGRRIFLRIGRQRVAWGDGRLVSDTDWSEAGRSLDAIRFGLQIGDVDIEAMAVLLAAPGGLPPAASGSREPVIHGTGSQLYGLDATWHLFPLLNFELTGLSRFVREPRPSWLTRSDTYVIDARIFGDRRGFRYALEGAYELGRIDSYRRDRSHSAFALAARAGLETSLPLHLTFEGEGAYASGDDGIPGGGSPAKKQRRFDPILPETHTTLGPMDLFAWSNILMVGGDVRMKFLDELDFEAGYRFVNLASRQGRWTTADLIPVGASTKSSSSSLGHEIDGALKFSPWKPVTFEGGYGIFIVGDGARRILFEAGRPAKFCHAVYLQTIIYAP